MKRIQYLSLVLLSITVTGCASHAGPFVTNISSDGRGGIIVEKCMAKFDPWMSTVNNDNCTSSTLQLSQPVSEPKTPAS